MTSMNPVREHAEFLTQPSIIKFASIKIHVHANFQRVLFDAEKPKETLKLSWLGDGPENT